MLSQGIVELLRFGGKIVPGNRCLSPGRSRRPYHRQDEKGTPGAPSIGISVHNRSNIYKEGSSRRPAPPRIPDDQGPGSTTGKIFSEKYSPHPVAPCPYRTQNT